MEFQRMVMDRACMPHPKETQLPQGLDHLHHQRIIKVIWAALGARVPLQEQVSPRRRMLSSAQVLGVHLMYHRQVRLRICRGT